VQVQIAKACRKAILLPLVEPVRHCAIVCALSAHPALFLMCGQWLCHSMKPLISGFMGFAIAGCCFQPANSFLSK
jgi:hypothetical protein